MHFKYDNILSGRVRQKLVILFMHCTKSRMLLKVKALYQHIVAKNRNRDVE